MKKVARTEIPRKAVYRLSVYLRCLHRLLNNSIHTVSSEVLAKAAGVKSTQLRKDLTYFGQFGTRGLGYDVEQLIEMITKWLGTKRLQPVVIVGVGTLGRALLRGARRTSLSNVLRRTPPCTGLPLVAAFCWASQPVRCRVRHGRLLVTTSLRSGQRRRKLIRGHARSSCRRTPRLRVSAPLRWASR